MSSYCSSSTSELYDKQQTPSYNIIINLRVLLYLDSYLTALAVFVVSYIFRTLVGKSSILFHSDTNLVTINGSMDALYKEKQ